jgi:hypothetical protein
MDNSSTLTSIKLDKSVLIFPESMSRYRPTKGRIFSISCSSLQVMRNLTFALPLNCCEVNKSVRRFRRCLCDNSSHPSRASMRI